jgi:hypothetical protein
MSLLKDRRERERENVEFGYHLFNYTACGREDALNWWPIFIYFWETEIACMIFSCDSFDIL